MKPVQPDQFMRMYKKRLASRGNLERMRAVGIMLEAEGDKFGTYLQNYVDDQYILRQAALGGNKYEKGSRHWDMNE